jgi:hypothetical protein
MGILERLFGYQGDPAAANLTPEQLFLGIRAIRLRQI